MRLRLELAETLHKTLGEIEQLPENEMLLWLAYSQIRNRERELEEAKARGR